ncbi:MAG TPA: alkaline phosphatase family protein, partial [Candidatus Sulfopaludibacter sp.]|nr:alkaline phosphatase family protein [Candidatus Sulfopaludibacter sp.]
SALALAASCGRRHVVRAAHAPEVIVLGIDAMDPVFLERHWNDLPNLARLHSAGSFRKLETVMPPQSPVAWSTFITGADPSVHGIFDFIHRRPRTLEVFSSMSEAVGGGWQIPIGPYLIPLSAGKIETFRKGTPFWEILANHGIPVTVLRMPVNFPPSTGDGDADEQLSGMGTPDLRGTFGTFTYFTDAPGVEKHDVGGGRVVPVKLADHQVPLRIPGPPNSLRRDGADTYVDLSAQVDPDANVARFQVQGASVVLTQGQWSGWLHVKFPLIPALKSAPGMFRLYVKQLHPAFELYVSPVNLDPREPAMPITNPPEFAGELARAVGSFYTQGMPEDTAALREGVFSVDEYLEQSRIVSQEHLRLLEYAVEHASGGLIFFHFFGVDQDSHMLWGRYDDKLLDTYRMVDREIGWVREHAPNALLLVMSDHGFSRFDWAVHVNRWLADHGFMALKNPDDKGAGEGFSNVDWSRTRAYAVGLNGLYLNLTGRERDGIVGPLDVDSLVADLRKGLQELNNPATGEKAVEEVYRTSELYHGTALDYAPDLLVGYRPGYRGSWQTALGGTPPNEIEPNKDAWLADHCIDSRFVPGVLLSNRKDLAAAPGLADVTASILREYGIQPPRQMAGREIFTGPATISQLRGDYVRK